MPFTPTRCPNRFCRHHRPAAAAPPTEARSAHAFFWRKGSFGRAGDQRVKRFQCKGCRRHFSEQTFQSDYRQKRPDLNPHLARLHRDGLSIRCAARLLGINRKTAARRYRILNEAACHAAAALRPHLIPARH